MRQYDNLDSNMELSFGYRVHRNIYAYLGYRARYDSSPKMRSGFRDGSTARSWARCSCFRG